MSPVSSSVLTRYDKNYGNYKLQRSLGRCLVCGIYAEQRQTPLNVNRGCSSRVCADMLHKIAWNATQECKGFVAYFISL